MKTSNQRNNRQSVLLFRQKALSSSVHTGLPVIALESFNLKGLKMSDEQTVKCPICGKPYKFYPFYAGDQSACPACQAEATKNMPKTSYN